ncbi:helix-turn-helix domain-containing protein [Kineococcus rhizosphaerae]|uniref:Helix-turn-helix protein n=1 Tax=Kineococcus rhizosphaerae TaxID=559628 RepID=A0A2T0R5S8_9ACTN|nr:helix-turn-helix domain-containing protein [Kineococcus rhizosphaerae]PRY16119.1 helix-turn-helix protein [Kineococcus rhizosphaerae]
MRRDRGAAVANALARRTVTAAHREGGQAQFVDHPVPAAGDDLAAVLDWARGHLEQDLPVEELARRALLSPRTFARRFRAATGTTPHRWLVAERLRRAEELLERTDLTVDAVAQRCGMGTADALRRQFTARRGVGPAAHRRSFRAGAPPAPALPAPARGTPRARESAS